MRDTSIRAKPTKVFYAYANIYTDRNRKERGWDGGGKEFKIFISYIDIQAFFAAFNKRLKKNTYLTARRGNDSHIFVYATLHEMMLMMSVWHECEWKRKKGRDRQSAYVRFSYLKRKSRNRFLFRKKHQAMIYIQPCYVLLISCRWCCSKCTDASSIQFFFSLSFPHSILDYYLFANDFPLCKTTYTNKQSRRHCTIHTRIVNNTLKCVHRSKWMMKKRNDFEKKEATAMGPLSAGVSVCVCVPELRLQIYRLMQRCGKSADV